MPQFTWEPVRPVFVDLETQSACDLKVHGARAYVRHPSTRLLSLVAQIDDEVIVWAPKGRYPGNTLHVAELPLSALWPEGAPRNGRRIVLDDGACFPSQLVRAADEGRTFVAHNAAGFDALAWDVLFGELPVTWYDTIPPARAAGLPAGLDALGEVLLGTGKDKAGSRALQLLYRATGRNGEWQYPVGTLPVWEAMLRYNVQDVLLLERVYHATLEYGEADVMEVDRVINERGIRFDRGLLDRLIDLWSEAEGCAVARVTELTEGVITARNIKSGPQVKAWLAGQGVKLATLNRQELERFYLDPVEYLGEVPETVDLERVIEVLQCRSAATRITKAKLQRLLDTGDDDDRVRGLLVYHGAHTGRWTGRGFQPHNIARGVGDLDVEGLTGDDLTLDAIQDAASRCKGSPTLDACMNTLLRPVFTASPGKTLLIIDYAAVEARGVAWMAGETGLLDTFADPTADVYLDMASRVFGRRCTKADKLERQVGKTIVLGCGYGMGVPKFAGVCKANGIDLQSAGTSAEECVEAYRDAYPAIAGIKQGDWRRGGLWRAYGEAAIRVVSQLDVVTTNRCGFTYDANTLHVTLPSGRTLHYRNARIEDRVPRYATVLGLNLKPRPTVVYRHPRGYDSELYGGLLTENIVQAVCRDLLATALVDLENLGWHPVLHVHDEIVCEVTDGRATEEMLRGMAYTMSTPPSWASGFPIGVEGFSCPRYSKSPFRDSHHVKALNGRIL
jgi:DNA polymerase